MRTIQEMAIATAHAYEGVLMCLLTGAKSVRRMCFYFNLLFSHTLCFKNTLNACLLTCNILTNDYMINENKSPLLSYGHTGAILRLTDFSFPRRFVPRTQWTVSRNTAPAAPAPHRPRILYPWKKD